MIGFSCSLTKRTTTMLSLNPIILFVILLSFQSFLWQDESKEAVLAGVDSLSKVQNKSNGELFQIHFFSFHGCFSLSLTQGVLFSQEKNFPFGWKNIFFLRLSWQSPPHNGGTAIWKRNENMLKRAVFSLFEGPTLSKSERPHVRQTAPYAYTRSGHLRRTGFPFVQKGSRIRGTSSQSVTGQPSQDSHISISVHPRTEITHSRKGYFDILTKMVS